MQNNPILKTLQLTKIDKDTKEVIKDIFTFGLYADKKCTELIQQVDSNAKEGTVTFKDLRFGTYFVKEISAPNGYILSEEIIKVEINENGVFIDDTQIDENENTIEFIFENKKIEIPKTGDESKLKLFAGTIILSLFGIIYIVIKNCKKK